MWIAKDILEEARRYSSKAVSYDREGDYKKAIFYYKQAINSLNKVIELYPDNPMNEVYFRRIVKYQERIKELENILEGNYQPAMSIKESEEKLSDFLLIQKPNITWEDIVNLEEAKQAIKESILYPLKRPDLFILGWPRGILLYGPPGCGKTMLAAAIANEIDGYFFYVDPASIMSKWLGESERNVKKLFDAARYYEKKGKPAIIIIDEIDALTSQYSQEVGGEVRSRAQLLKEMDSLLDKGRKSLIYVIGSTNKPWMLDEPFIRRFQKRIFIPPPDTRARVGLFRMYTRGFRLSSDVNFERLAALTDGYSGHDIFNICRDAYMIAIRELFERNKGKGEPRPLSFKDFELAISKRKPSINKELIKRYHIWEQRYKAI